MMKAVGYHQAMKAVQQIFGAQSSVKCVIAEQVIKIVNNHLRVGVFKTSDTFDYLGADSLNLIEMLMDLEDTFNIDVEDSIAESFKTPDDVIKYLMGVKVA